MIGFVIGIFYIVLFIPIAILFEKIFKSYEFKNKFVNLFLIFNTIFGSPMAILAGWMLLIGGGMENYIYLYNDIVKLVVFIFIIITATVLKLLIWLYIEEKEVSLVNVLGFCKFNIFQILFLWLLYPVFHTKLYSDGAGFLMILLFFGTIIELVYSFFKFKLRK